MWGSKGAEVLGWWNMGTQQCRASGVWGLEECSMLGVPGVHGDGGVLCVRTLGCRDTAAGQCDAMGARLEPHTYCAAPSTPGKRVMAKWAML